MECDVYAASCVFGGAVSEFDAVGEVFILVLNVSICYCVGFSFLGNVYLEG